MRLNALLIAAGAVALLSAAAPALAEDAAPQPAPAAAAPQPAATAPAAPSGAPAAPAVVPDAIKAWAKFCDAQDDGRQVCIVRKLTFNGTNIEASIVLRLDSKKGTPALAIAAVPVGVALKPGLTWQVDNNKPQVLPYWRCTPQTCESEQLASPDFLNRLRKGKTLTLTAKNVDGKDVSVDVPLAGFSAAFDQKDAPTYVEYSKQMAAAQAAAQAAAK
jgi:invasion protein IalB